MSTHRYFLLNKPFGMVSQFIGEEELPMLSQLNYSFPPGIHAIGRLDKDSEGLLLLTTDTRVTRLLFQGEKPHRRTYVVRVNGVVTEEKLQQLRTGVNIRIHNGEDYTTPSTEVELLPHPPQWLFPHQLEARTQVPHSWLRICLYEGKYHQVRKMVRAVYHPCRRLIRESIEDITAIGMAPGEVREVSAHDFFTGLRIDVQ